MKTVEEVTQKIREDIESVEVDMLENMQFSLADAIREGSKHSEQAHGWGDGDSTCALSAAYVSTKARGYVS